MNATGSSASFSAIASTSSSCRSGLPPVSAARTRSACERNSCRSTTAGLKSRKDANTEFTLAHNVKSGVRHSTWPASSRIE